MFTAKRRCVVPIRSLESGDIIFDLVFYGLETHDLLWIDLRHGRSGAAPIHAALRKRGIDPSTVVASMFEIRDGGM